MADSKDTDEVEVQEETQASDETEEVKEETAEDSEDEQSTETDDESESSEEESQDESEEAPFKKRFTQFKGETPEEYQKELEDAYANSQAEYERLKLGKAEESETESQSEVPKDDHGYDLWAQQTEREYKEFSDENDLFRTDENIRKEVIEEYLPIVAAVFKKKHGYNISMKEGLKRAYKAAGHSEGDSVSLKSSASTPRANSKRSSKPAPTNISPKQIEVARKVDPSLKGKSDSEVAQALAKVLQ